MHMHMFMCLCVYIYIYIYSETSLYGDREEYITKENYGKKNYIYIKIL